MLAQQNVNAAMTTANGAACKNGSSLKEPIPAPLPTAAQLLAEIPTSDKAATTVANARKEMKAIFDGQDDRMIVIVGPCSIHDPKAAMEYAQRLKGAIQRYNKELCIVMRVYLEKPRSTVGWKGLIREPFLDGVQDIAGGLRVSRQLTASINDLGVPTATEFLDPMTQGYLADLMSYGAVGARTSESQIHREMASGLPLPVGFKNGCTGSVGIAADAILAASNPQVFIGLNQNGHGAVTETPGNPDCHVILRGSSQGPNYSPQHVADAKKLLESKKLPQKLVVDCSHGNSGKDHRKQCLVSQSVSEQRKGGDKTVVGVMIESNLVAGAQKVVEGQQLTYGKSITDACVDWEETVEMLECLADAVKDNRDHIPSTPPPATR